MVANDVRHFPLNLDKRAFFVQKDVILDKTIVEGGLIVQNLANFANCQRVKPFKKEHSSHLLLKL